MINTENEGVLTIPTVTKEMCIYNPVKPLSHHPKNLKKEVRAEFVSDELDKKI